MKKIFFEEITSTNTYAKENIEKIDDKTVIYANRQTNGRGRFSRKWIDLGSRNLYMTIILHPGDKLKQVHSNLTQYLSVKTCKVIETYGICPQIKWPNDVLIDGKKIAGILSEAVFRKGELKGIALGVGVNLNVTTEDIIAIPDKIATSLNLEIGCEVNRNEFLDKLIEEFFKDYENFLVEGFKSIKETYLKYVILKGEKITVQVLNREVEGKFETINDDGTIKLITNKGEENLSIGDII